MTVLSSMDYTRFIGSYSQRFGDLYWTLIHVFIHWSFLMFPGVRKRKMSKTNVLAQQETTILMLNLTSEQL